MSSAEPSSDTFTIRAGAALVGPELDIVSPAEISISDGVIVSVGAPENEGPAEPLSDLPGTMLIPGFIDAHVHIGFFEPQTLLEGGLTTVRDLAWPAERIFSLVQASSEKGFGGPQVFAAGPMLTAPGGYPTQAGWAPPETGLEVEGPSAARAAVAEVAEAGSTVVKVALNPPVGPTLDLATLSAIVDEAHAQGLKTTGHVFGLEELEKALDAGLDELGHMLMSPERIPDAVIDRMVSGEMRVVPTLSIRFRRDQKVAIDNLRRFIAAGGRVVYGTDLGNSGPEPGIDLREITAMQAAGMSGLEIIRSATVDSAEWLSLDDRGYLKAGMRADVIGVPMVAVDDATALTDVTLVIREGVVSMGL